MLFVISDDMRPIIGPYREKGVEKLLAKTPNLDKFAKGSTMFKHAYSQFALCGPSRTSLLTSRRPDTTKVYINYAKWRLMAGNYSSLPQYFKSSGYFSHSIGKVFHKGRFNEHVEIMDWPLSWSSKPLMPHKDIPLEVMEEDGETTKYFCPPTKEKSAWDNRAFCPVDETYEESLLDVQIRKEAVEFIKNYDDDSGLLKMAEFVHHKHTVHTRIRFN